MEIIFARGNVEDIDRAIGELAAFTDYTSFLAYNKEVPFELCRDSLDYIHRDFSRSLIDDYSEKSAERISDIIAIGYNSIRSNLDTVRSDISYIRSFIRNLSKPIIVVIALFFIAMGIIQHWAGSVIDSTDFGTIWYYILTSPRHDIGTVSILAFVGFSFLITAAIVVEMDEEFKKPPINENTKSVITQLGKQIRRLSNIADLIEISNYIENEYDATAGNIRIKLKGNKGEKITIKSSECKVKLNNLTEYERDEKKKSFIVNSDESKKIFHDGVIDFSWLDGEIKDVIDEVKKIGGEAVLSLTDNNKTLRIETLKEKNNG